MTTPKVTEIKSSRIEDDTSTTTRNNIEVINLRQLEKAFSNYSNIESVLHYDEGLLEVYVLGLCLRAYAKIEDDEAGRWFAIDADNTGAVQYAKTVGEAVNEIIIALEREADEDMINIDDWQQREDNEAWINSIKFERCV